jgi:hypothetical protein
VGWQIGLHFINNILRSLGLFGLIHLILPKGLSSIKVKTPYLPNEDFPSKGE